LASFLQVLGFCCVYPSEDFIANRCLSLFIWLIQSFKKICKDNTLELVFAFSGGEGSEASPQSGQVIGTGPLHGRLSVLTIDKEDIALVCLLKYGTVSGVGASALL